MTMTIKKCDRCGALYEFALPSKTELKYQLRKRYPDSPTSPKLVDLCPECQEKLKNWFEKGEG